MTPKEKADELIKKFKEYADEDYMDTKHPFELNETRNLNAKKCAIIAVNEILDLGYVPKEKSSFQVYEFYSNVKIELEKL